LAYEGESGPGGGKYPVAGREVDEGDGGSVEIDVETVLVRDRELLVYLGG